jgi:mannosidase alpha-like ER degradation enhancer 1
MVAMNKQNPVKEPGVPRPPEIQLHFMPDFVDPLLQSSIPGEDLPEEVVFTAYTASFGGNPAAPPMEGLEPIIFGHGEGVPIVRGWNNTFGCTPYDETFQDEAVVVRRGECTFLQKLVLAQNAGASGVVAINDNDVGVRPSAEKKETNDAGDAINQVALVVITQAAGRVLEHMLDTSETLGGQVWMIVGPESTSPDTMPTPEPTRTQQDSAAKPKILYINGHGLVNTRLLD